MRETDDDEQLEELTFDAKADEILSVFNAGADDETWTVDIYRVDGNSRRGGTEAFCMSLDMGDLYNAPAMVRDNHGSGVYRAKVRCNRQLRKNITFSVERPEMRTAAASSELNSVVQQLIKRMDESDRFIRDQLQRPQPNPSYDPMPLMQGMFTMFTNMQTALQSRSSDSALGGIEKMFDFVEKLHDRGTKSEGGLTGMVSDLLRSPIVEKAVEQLTAQQPQQPQQQPRPMQQPQAPRLNPVQHRPAQPIRNPQRPPPLAPRPTRDIQPTEIKPENVNGKEHAIMSALTNPEAAQIFTKNIQYLITRAKNNSDPELYAEWFIDNTPEEYQEGIAEALQTPNLIDEIGKFMPEVLEHKAWFQALIECILSPAEDETADEHADDITENTGGAKGDI